MEIDNIQIPNDQPIEKDNLGRDTILLGVASVVLKVEPPFVIGIYGDWGSGKTSFMRCLRNLLDGEQRNSDLDNNNHNSINNRFNRSFGEEVDLPVIWYNPWKYQFEEEPILPLLEEIKNQIPERAWNKVAKSIKLVIEDPIFRVIGKAALGVGSLVGPDWLDALEKSGSKIFGNGNSSTIRNIFQDFSKLDSHIEESAKLLLEELQVKKGNLPRKIVVIIDDLDRCESEFVVKMLESLKLHLLNKYCVFVMGAADERVKDSLITQKIASDHKSAEEYLEKIVQLSIHLPHIWDNTLEQYIHLIAGPILPEKTDDYNLVFQLLKKLSYGNPRKLKKFVAWYMFQISMIEMVEDLDSDDKAGLIIKNTPLLLKIKALQFLYPSRFKIPKDFEIDFLMKDEVDKENKGSNLLSELYPYVGHWLKENNSHEQQLQLLLALTINKSIAKSRIDELKDMRNQLDMLSGDWEGVCEQKTGNVAFYLHIEFKSDSYFLGHCEEDGKEGRSEISGEVDLPARTITFRKANENNGSYEIVYTGSYDHKFFVTGQWTIGDAGSGSFNMVKA